MSSPVAVVDAGGTSTRVEIRAEGHVEVVEMSSLAPVSASEEETRRGYAEILARLAAAGVAETYVATSAFDDETADTLAGGIGEIGAEQGYAGRIHLLNDAMPLVFGPATREAVGIILGTGSAFWSRDEADRVSRVGGVEWVGADEGAATDLGRRALQAMVRAADGRGPETAITRHAGLDDAGALLLARELGEMAHPKGRVAALARHVTAALADGDEVAAGIVDAAIADVEIACRAAARKVTDPAAARWTLCGGLVAKAELYGQRARAAARAAGAVDIEIVDNALPLLRALAAAGDAERIPARFRRTVSL